MAKDLRSLMDRLYAEGWEPRCTAVMKGERLEMKILWSRRSPVFTNPSTLPHVTLIHADTGKEIRT
jgi:hypothetical protein